MSHWLLDRLDESRQQALKQASRAQIHRELLNAPFNEDVGLIRRTAEALELVVLDLILEGTVDNDDKRRDLKFSAADAFRLLRVIPRPGDTLESAKFLLRAAALAVLGDKGSEAARWLREDGWAELPVASENWSERTWATIIDVWLRLIRKHGWEDRDAVLEQIARLRDSQASFERDYLASQNPAQTKGAALELVGLYHLAKAAEIFAHYMTDGVVDGRHQIHQLLDTHFDRVHAVCQHSQMLELEPLTRLLAACASQMSENSI